MRAQASLWLVLYLACSLSVLASSGCLYYSLGSRASLQYQTRLDGYNALYDSTQAFASMLK